MSLPAERPDPSPVILHGRLRKKFGPRLMVTASTPNVAVYNLMRIVPGLKEELERGCYRVIRGSLKNGLVLEPGMLCFRLNGESLHLVPAAAGAAKSGGLAGAIKIVLGVVLVGLALASGFGVFGVSGFFGSAGWLGTNALSVGIVGAGLIFSGIGAILTHIPKPPNPNASFLLNPPSNITAQGGPVFLNYGFRIRVGSVVISAGYQAIALVAGQYTDNSYPNGTSPNDGWGDLGAGGSGGGGLSGGVNSVEVYHSGSGYTYCNVTFTPTSGGTGAAAHAVITSGVVSEIVVDSEGSGYEAAPVVNLAGDGTGAAALATVTSEG